MGLPIQKTVTYTTKIPSTDTVVKFRPFLVKEEKALLVAQQSDDQQVMVDTLKGVIQSCVVGDYDVNKLALFDIEFLFTQLRAKSVGENVDLILKCDTCEDEKAKVQVSIDLTKLQVEKPEGHTNNIRLFEDVGVIMRYPSIELLSDLQSISEEDAEAVFSIVAKSIDKIYAGEEVHHTDEYTKEELMEFLENLTQDQFRKVQGFFETMPRLEKTMDFKCPVCAKENKVRVQGLDSFF
jgi:hypothetical protein